MPAIIKWHWWVWALAAHAHGLAAITFTINAQYVTVIQLYHI